MNKGSDKGLGRDNGVGKRAKLQREVVGGGSSAYRRLVIERSMAGGDSTIKDDDYRNDDLKNNQDIKKTWEIFSQIWNCYIYAMSFS